MGKETLYRFELSFAGEEQGVGILQGLADTPIPFVTRDELFSAFDSLPVPKNISTPDDSQIVFWFTEKGLQQYANAINTIIQDLEEYDWQVVAMPLAVDADMPNTLSLQDALYKDEFQVAFSRSDILEFINFDFKEISRIDINFDNHLVFNEDNSKMDLKKFLSYFDFDYDIVPPGGKYEDRIRQGLLEDGDLSPDDISKDLICLIDKQGAYFGNIGKDRFPINRESVEKIINRMEIYIQDYVFDEFITALEDRDIDTSNMSLGEMIAKCKYLNVGEGEVCYSVAEAVNSPETIYIMEALEHEKNNIVLDFGNIVSELEAKHLKLLKVKDNNNLFVVDHKGNLYGIEPYYAGGYLDRFIGEKFVVSFERMEQPVRDFEDWRKEFMDASWVKSFIERVVKKEYPSFKENKPSLSAQIQSASSRTIETHSVINTKDVEIDH